MTITRGPFTAGNLPVGPGLVLSSADRVARPEVRGHGLGRFPHGRIGGVTDQERQAGAEAPGTTISTTRSPLAKASAAAVSSAQTREPISSLWPARTARRRTQAAEPGSQ
jgi:hypothetical protein